MAWHYIYIWVSNDGGKHQFSNPNSNYKRTDAKTKCGFHLKKKSKQTQFMPRRKLLPLILLIICRLCRLCLFLFLSFCCHFECIISSECLCINLHPLYRAKFERLWSRAQKCKMIYELLMRLPSKNVNALLVCLCFFAVIFLFFPSFNLFFLFLSSTQTEFLNAKTTRTMPEYMNIRPNGAGYVENCVEFYTISIHHYRVRVHISL